MDPDQKEATEEFKIFDLVYELTKSGFAATLTDSKQVYIGYGPYDPVTNDIVWEINGSKEGLDLKFIIRHAVHGVQYNVRIILQMGDCEVEANGEYQPSTLLGVCEGLEVKIREDIIMMDLGNKKFKATHRSPL
jgi:hypothetical protein